MARPKRSTRSDALTARQLADQTREQRAWNAIKEFNKLTPTLTSFARALTGDSKVVVRAHPTQSMTDGRVIHIAPPIAFGDRLDHQRPLCETRDPVTRIKLCLACAARELLMRRTFHEISHIIFKSMDKPLAYLRARVIKMINEWHPADACDHQLEALPKARAARNYLELGGAFSSYVVGLNRVYEDARVDSKMYRVRPGLKTPTEASMHHTFTRGIERPDGTVFWRDTKLEAQITIGLLLLGMGLDVHEGWLSDEARQHLEDPKLKELSERALFAGSAANAFELALDVFLYLQDVGLLVVPKCRKTPPLPQPPSEENSRDSDPGDGDAEKSSKGEESSDDSTDGDPADDESTGFGEPGPEQGDSGDEDAEPGPRADDPSSDEFDNEDSTRDGDDREDGDSTDESDEAGVSSGDEDEESADEGEDSDSLGDGDDDQSAAEKSEAKPGDLDPGEEPLGMDEESADGNSNNESAGGDADDSSGESDDDGPDGGSAAQGFDPAQESSTDPGVEPTDSDGDFDLEEGPVEDGERTAVEEAGAGDIEQVAPPSSPDVKGEEVWEDENPDTEVIAVEVVDLLDQFHGHGDEDKVDAEILGEDPVSPWEQDEEREAISRAVQQAPIFDTFSGAVGGLQVITYPDQAMAWGHPDPEVVGLQNLPAPEDFMPHERIIGRTLLEARVVFTENKRAKHQRGLKSGRVSSGLLGRRAAIEDPRLFQKKRVPGKRDYEFLIGVDVSGSTRMNGRIERIKRSVFAQAELLNRLNVKFAIYAHTGGWDRNNPWAYSYAARRGMYEVWLLKVKGVEEPWSLQTRTRLAHLNPLIENLDGHTIEFYRKQLEKSRATDRVLLYYTDGAMPAANKYEELGILQRELLELDRKGIVKLAVGINTDSPSKHGFDTVQVDSDEDLSKVVAQLKRYLV